ncbi:MAG: NAD-dependent epimerase/dehydratase family protein [Bacteroidota bacterium]
MASKISILGTGWLGAALFKDLLSSNYTVYGSTRSTKRRMALEDFKVALLKSNRQITATTKLFSLEVPNLQAEHTAFFDTDVLIITIPPGRRRPNVINAYSTEVKVILDWAIKYGTKHLIYTSSTGIYGNTTGVVDEKTPPSPSTPSSRAVVAAEQLIQSSLLPSTILRLAGLYGPGRHPGRWFGSKPTLPNADAPVNLVHQYDVVAAVRTVIENASWDQVYNVCAQAHPTKGEFYTKAVLDLGLDLPALESGGTGGKIVDSQKIRSNLGWSPHFDALPLT